MSNRIEQYFEAEKNKKKTEFSINECLAIDMIGRFCVRLLSLGIIKTQHITVALRELLVISEKVEVMESKLTE